MSSSDSSDDENLQNIREAADNQFINDSMFKGTPKTEESHKKQQIVIQESKLPSLRPNRDEFDDKSNPFRVTQSFQKHVSKKLEVLLDNAIEYEERDDDKPKKKKKRSAVKLLKTSEVFLEGTPKQNEQVNEVIAHRKKVKRKRDLVATDEMLKSVAVSPEYILSKQETKSWSNRSKAEVFSYKKNKAGKFEIIEREFK